MRLGTLVLAAVLALAVAQPAEADSDADAAREFSYAAYRLRVAVKAQGPEMARRQAELSGCFDVVEKAPRSARGDAMKRHYVANFLVMLDAARAPLATFIAELDRVPVRDAALRRGRIAWRHNVADLATIAPVPADICEQFRRWRAAGYSRATRPAVDLATVKRINEDEENAGERRDRRLDAAVRRMRALGVGRSAAERFNGEMLFENIPELEIEVIE